MKRMLSAAFAVAPFAFGLFRYLQTGSDLRMLWMALASFIGAMIVVSMKLTNASAVVTFVVATAFAAVAGFLLGATAGPGAIMVAAVFGFCWAACTTLATRAQGARAA